MNTMNRWCATGRKGMLICLLLVLLLTSATSTPVLVHVASAQGGGGSKQVVYHTADGHIHELYVTLGGIWQHADLSALTGAPPTVSIPIGYSWKAGGSKQVVYITADRHIHELYVTADGIWRHADLSVLTGTPPPSSALSAYAWEAGGSKQVVYLGADGHIHELYVTLNDIWRHADLSVLTGAPTPNSALSAYAWEAGGSKQVIYHTADGHIHELYVTLGGIWRHADLSVLTGAPALSSSATCSNAHGYAWEAGGSKQVVYQANDGHIHELYVTVGGAWQHADLSVLTGATITTPCLFGGYGWETGGSKQVNIWGADGHIHELYVTLNGTWQHADLTESTGAPPAVKTPSGYAWEGGRSKQVVYQANDGHIHELYVTAGGTWQHADLSEATGAPLPAIDAFSSGYAWDPGSGNIHADTDQDGLTNDVERLMCTSPTNPDSDHDGLQDGWEVRGLRFPDGDFIDLPAMGSNPCSKDIFVQYDYERGARSEPNVWPYVINLFSSHGMTLHLTENERPRPASTANGVSSVGAEQAASLKDASGIYYFPPKLSWTHHYIYSRHSPERSSTWKHVRIDVNTNNCPLTTPNPQTDPACGPRYPADQVYRIVHELGHNLGLGHGGMQPGDIQHREGDFIFYEGYWENTNLKPNYLSVMNYGYNNGVLCFNPATGAFVGDVDYSDTQLPTLNEANLAETDSNFAAAIRGRACSTTTPGFVPVIQYSCKDTLGNRYIIAVNSDTQRMVARLKEGSATWQITNLPQLPAGINWNCDGSITPASQTVQANINGGINATTREPDWYADGSATEVLASTNDWQSIPSTAGFACDIRQASQLKDTIFPEAYFNAIGPADCRLLSPASAVNSSAARQSTVRTNPEPSSQGILPDNDEPLEENFINTPSLPNLELCDSQDNDSDGSVDEGCLDSDADSVANALDNCPQTANSDQADLDDNNLGDACQQPSVSNLKLAGKTLTSVTLTWDVSTPDGRGFNIYRQRSGEATPIFLGDSYPSTGSTTFTSHVAKLAQYRYFVRPVNLHGQEGKEAFIDVVAGPATNTFLPLVRKP